jgi:hypothetical protein
MRLTLRVTIAVLPVTIGLAIGGFFAVAATAAPDGPDATWVMAQAMVPATGMGDADKAMAREERMRRRFPQSVRVGFLTGLPVLDDDSRTIGVVRHVVRTPQDKIELVVACGGWFGWGTRAVAVPVEVVGMLGRQVASLDMPRSEYASAPTWRDPDATVLPSGAVILVALARR